MLREVEHRFHVEGFELGIVCRHFRQRDFLSELVELPLLGVLVNRLLVDEVSCASRMNSSR